MVELDRSAVSVEAVPVVMYAHPPGVLMPFLYLEVTGLQVSLRLMANVKHDHWPKLLEEKMLVSGVRVDKHSPQTLFPDS